MKIIILLCLFLSLKTSVCGHIYAYDVVTEWQNARFTDKIIFTFSLENPIAENDFLRIVSPINLGTISAKIISGSNTLSVVAASDQSPHYYFNGVTLSPMTIYKLEIVPSIKPQQGGNMGVFRMYTQSANKPHAFCYDFNEAFGMWAVAPPPPSSLQVSAPLVASESLNVRYDPGAEYTLHFDLTSKVDSTGFTKLDVEGGSQFIGTLTNGDFTIKNCVIEGYTCPVQNTFCTHIVIPSRHTCTTEPNKFVLDIASDVWVDQKIRVRLTIVNPSKYASTDIDILHTSRYTKLIYEVKLGIDLASTSTVDLFISDVKTLWGLSTSNSFACPVGIYQPTGTSSSSAPVINNVWIEFQVAKAISGEEFGLMVWIGPGSRIFGLLEGSIYHEGLSPLQNSEIVCSSNYETVNSNTAIVCRGIGAFTSDVTYGIGARVYTKAYDRGDTFNDFLIGNNFPRIQLFTIENESSSVLSQVFSYTQGLKFFKNADMMPTSGKNLGAISDNEGRQVFSTNWALTYKRTSFSSPFLHITNSDIYTTLCLKESTGVTVYDNSTEKNCSVEYKYGAFKEKLPLHVSDGLVLFINGANFDAGIYNLTVIPSTDFQKNTHFVHKFMFHKDFSSFNVKKFGLNMVNNIFGDTASKATGTQVCNPTGSEDIYCYPSLDLADTQFTEGVREVFNGPDKIYLYNKFEYELDNHALVTITCVPKSSAVGLTDPVQNCAFYGSSRREDALSFPGFEFETSEPIVQNGLKSSIYPDQRVRDFLYCLYKIPHANIGNDGSVIRNVKPTDVGGGIELKLQALLNFFHIDVPQSSSHVKSEISFLNNACIFKSNSPTAFSTNDGNHIPLLLRINYDVRGVEGAFDAAAIFFSLSSELQQVPHSQSNTGIFGSAKKGSQTSSLFPHHLNTNFYDLPTSNVGGSTEKVNAKGFSLAGNSGTKAANKFMWNYQPYVLFTVNNIFKTDFYVNINLPESILTQNSCDDFFHFENVVIAFLKKKQNSQYFYDVQEAINIYSLLRYAGGEYYSSKNALNLGGLQGSYIDSGNNKQWNPFTLYDGNSCAPSNSLYPISNNYQVGLSSTLIFSIRTTSIIPACKEVKKVNDGFPGSAVTISYLTNLNAPILIADASSPAGNPINALHCARLDTTHRVSSTYSGTVLQTLVCPFTSSNNIDLSTVSSDITLNLKSKVPWFWGINANANAKPLLEQILTTAWTVSGKVAFAIGQKYASGQPSSITPESCIATAYSPFYLETDTQKVTWTLFNRKSSIVLPETFVYNGNLIGNQDQKLTIFDDVTVHVTNSLFIHSCQTNIPNLNCEISRTGTVLQYTLSVANNAQVVIGQNYGIQLSLIASFNRNAVLSNVKHVANASLFAGISSLNNGQSEINVLKCGNLDTDIPSTGSRTKAMYLSNIIFSKSKSVMSTFEFTFRFSHGLGFWQTSNADADVHVVLALGSLWNSSPLTSNVKCMLLTPANSISSDFETIALSNSNFTLRFKKPTENLDTYKFRCFGGLSPASNTNGLHVEAVSGRGVLMNGSAVLNAEFQRESVASTVNSVQAYFASPGFKSVWNFNVTFRSEIVAGKSMVYIYFPTSFSPKLSSSASPSCYMDNTLVRCYFISDYQLAVTPRVSSLPEKPLAFQINGIEMPLSYKLYRKVNIQLDNNDNYIDGILENVEAEAAPIFSAPFSIGQIPILHYSLSNTYAKERGSHRFILSLPRYSVQDGKKIYVLFPDAYYFSLHLSSLESCVMKNEYSTSTTNLIESCKKIGDHIVSLTFKTDNENTSSDQIYLLDIGTFDNLQFSQTLMNVPSVFFSNNDESGVISMSTVGYFNSSTVQITNNPNLLDLSFKDGTNSVRSGKAYKGYFGSEFTLSYPEGSFSSGLIFNGVGTYASNFKVWQHGQGRNEEVAVKAGTSSGSFWIGVDSNYCGLGLLQWNKKDNDERTSNIPILPIYVDFSKCVITPRIATRNIPSSPTTDTFSLPVIFDFSACIPITLVGITATITENPDNRFYLPVETALLENDYGAPKTILAFKVGLRANSTGPLNAQVQFSLMGANGDSYKLSEGTLTFSSTLPTNRTGNPFVRAFPSIGQVNLDFHCMESGEIYWVLGIGLGSVELSEIKERTESKRVSQTQVNSLAPNATIYGWTTQDNPNAKVNILIKNQLKSGANYKAIAYCKNQYNFINPPLVTSWNQSAINPFYGLVTFILSGVPSPSDNQILLNTLCKQLQAVSSDINDNFENRCDNNNRRLQIAPSINANNATNYSWYLILHPNVFDSDNSAITRRINLISGKNFDTLNVPALSVFQLGNVSVSQITLPKVAPVILTNSSIVNVTDVNITYQVKTNERAILFACVHGKFSFNPDATQLKLGKDGNNNYCISFVQHIPIMAETEKLIDVHNLTASSEYKISVMVSGFNIGSVETKYSDVSTYLFTTQSTSFGVRLFSLLMFISVIILCLF